MSVIRGKQVNIDHSPSNYPNPGPVLEGHLTEIDNVLGTIPPQTITTSDPGVNDDVNSGQQVGYQWLNTSTPSFWVCADNSAGAAVWLRLDT